jgi:hypothetical protein
MEGTAPRPRVAKEPDDKKAVKSQLKRKAKDEAGTKLKKKLAELEPSDDEDDEDGLPLASVRKRTRLKREYIDDESSDEYMNRSEIVKKEEDFGYEDFPVKQEVDDGSHDVLVKQEPAKEVAQDYTMPHQENTAQADTDVVVTDCIKQEVDEAQDYDMVPGDELAQHGDAG